MIKSVSSVIVAACVFFISLPIAAAGAVQRQLPFEIGEKLTYEISWSNILQAGSAVMEVREAPRTDGRRAYHLVSKAASSGLVSKFYKVSDTVESVIDAEELCSLSFRLDQRHGKRKKKRDMLFDHDRGIAHVFSDGKEENYTIPEDVQDALSALYYVRARPEFSVEKPIIVNVHEDGKTWSVEVQTLGREKIKTPLGKFNTIKLKTYPRYEGVFQNKGEIYIWLTDDERKIPVLMRSTISIGSIVSTLVDLRKGDENEDDKHGIETSLPSR